MEKELEILKHLNELYVGDTNDEEIIHYAEKNSEKVAAWKAAFEAYDLADVLAAIDEYWNFKNNKNSPRVAQILAILNSKKEVEKDKFSADFQPSRFDESNWRYWVGIDLARAFMIRGQLAGKNIARCFYDRAVKDILAHRVDTLPGSSGWSYGQRVKVAFQNNFFDDVDTVAEQIQSNEISHLPPLKNPINFLAAHWKVGA